jgi:hypothetical protein
LHWSQTRRRFHFVTEPSAILVVVTVPVAIVGFGYVPERSPPAAPDAGKLVGITPAASFDAVTDPSASLAEVTDASTILAVVIVLN